MLFVFWIIADNEKLKILNEPLLPWDLFFIKQLVNLLPVIYKELNILLVLSVLVIYCILIFVFVKKMNGSSLQLRSRLIVVIVSVIAILFIGSFKDNFVGRFFQQNNITVIEWDQKINQNTNGLVLGFLLNIPSVLIDKPNNYNRSTVEEIAHNYTEKRIQQNSTTQKPNIIVIMSEAFWDIGNLDEVLAQENYIPNVQKLQVGTVASPQFGGGTANVEFEVLTGLSANLLPAGSIAYQQYVKRETPSLASILSAEGYRSIAIHTYFKWFWDRENVYRHLGFDQFTSVTEMPDAQNKGVYVADSEITKEIIKEIEGNEEPVFIYAITMQNHGSYYDHRYEDATIKVPSEYSEETTVTLNTYVTGLVDADRELGSLVNYLNTFNEPTIIVFFGDHLPFLGADYKAYVEAGYIDNTVNWSLQDTLKMKETPLVMWNNFGQDNKQLGAISTSFVGVEILEMAGLQKPVLFEFIQQFSRELPVYTSTVKKTMAGKLMEETPEQLLPIEEQYKILQYDILFGECYIKSATN
ncbi:LTA synthase family protein [Lysinibacillus macroides]|uniref:LTA synthase family protein n=1 Tax=Lysinibacillus macroides TaxID=33935 RepID=UPI0006B59F12|nr:LTA synthase family protein [Lysinibacillus macroides]QPR66646.1 LTA synthase family protein [Lysinibacillus macroides]